MKIRQGFVSNSSSSSFACICKPIDLDNIKSIKDIWVDANESGNEGQLFFPLTKELFKYFKENHGKYNLDFYEVYVTCYDERDKNLDLKKIPKGAQLKALTIDQWSPDTVREWKEWFNESNDEDNDEDNEEDDE